MLRSAGSPHLHYCGTYPPRVGFWGGISCQPTSHPSRAVGSNAPSGTASSIQPLPSVNPRWRATRRRLHPRLTILRVLGLRFESKITDFAAPLVTTSGIRAPPSRWRPRFPLPVSRDFFLKLGNRWTRSAISLCCRASRRELVCQAFRHPEASFSRIPRGPDSHNLT